MTDNQLKPEDFGLTPKDVGLLREEKLEWIKTLKVGDKVEDCRYEVHTIKELRECRYSIPDWLRWLYRWADWLPGLDYLEKRFENKTTGRLYDVDLILDDGQHCSAMHCCDPVEKE